MPQIQSKTKKDVGPKASTPARNTSAARKPVGPSVQRGITTGARITPADVLTLQRTAGNRAVGALIQRQRQAVIQRKKPLKPIQGEDDSGYEADNESESESSDTEEEVIVAQVEARQQRRPRAYSAPSIMSKQPVQQQAPVIAPVQPQQQNVPVPIMQGGGGQAQIPMGPPPLAATTPSVLMTSAAFRTATYQGKMSRRGPTLKETDRMLDAYHNGIGRPLNSQNIETAIDMVKDIQELSSVWLQKHDGDTAQAKRISAVANLIGQTINELAILNQIRGQLTASGLQLAPTGRVASKKLRKEKMKLEGSANSLFSAYGYALDAAVPNIGDRTNIDFEFKIPVDPHSIGYVGGRMITDIERRMTDKKLKTSTEVTATGGGILVGIGELKGELGGYFETQGATGDMAAKLISYGLYRRWRESKWLPHGAANFMWGGRSAGQVGYNRAEKWAAGLEETAFTKEVGDKHYAETGGVVAASGKFGIPGVGSAGFESRLRMGKRYDYDSVNTLKEGGLGKMTKNKRGAHKQAGRDFWTPKFTVDISAGPFAGKVGLKMEFATTPSEQLDLRNKEKKSVKEKLWGAELHYKKVELEIGAEAMLPGGDVISTVIDDFDRVLANGILGAQRIVAAKNDLEKDKDSPQAARLTGEGLSIAGDIGAMIGGISTAPEFKTATFKAIGGTGATKFTSQAGLSARVKGEIKALDTKKGRREKKAEGGIYYAKAIGISSDHTGGFVSAKSKQHNLLLGGYVEHKGDDSKQIPWVWTKKNYDE